MPVGRRRRGVTVPAVGWPVAPVVMDSVVGRGLRFCVGAGPRGGGQEREQEAERLK